MELVLLVVGVVVSCLHSAHCACPVVEPGDRLQPPASTPSSHKNTGGPLTTMLRPLLLVLLACCLAVHAFVVPVPASSSCARYVCSIALPLHFGCPKGFQTLNLNDNPASFGPRKTRLATSMSTSFSSSSSSSSSAFLPSLRRLLSFAPALLLGPLLPAALDVPSAHAISGGGKDYAEAKIADQDFSGKDYSNKDFSGAFAVGSVE